MGVPFERPGRYFFDVKLMDNEIMRTLRLGFATAQYLPDLAGMRSTVGDEEAKLDRAGCGSLVLLPIADAPRVDGVAANGDAPVSHSVFPRSPEAYHRINEAIPLYQETDDVLRKHIVRLRLWGVGTADVSGDHAVLVRRTHALLEIRNRMGSQTGTTVDEVHAQRLNICNYYKLSVDEILGSLPQSDSLVFGCIVDTETRTINFTFNGRLVDLPPLTVDADVTTLFPLVCLQPMGRDMVQIRLDSPDCPSDCKPLVSGILSSTSRLVQGATVSRLQLQVLQQCSWRPVTAAPISIARQHHSFRVAVGDGSRLTQPFGRYLSLARNTVIVNIPQEHRLVPLCALVESEEVLDFLAATVQLFCTACASGNSRVTLLAAHLFPNALLFYAIQMPSLPAHVAAVFYDVLVTLHLPAGNLATEHKHFIIPFSPNRQPGSAGSPGQAMLGTLSRIEQPNKRRRGSVRGDRAHHKAQRQLVEFPYSELRSFVLQALTAICVQCSSSLTGKIRSGEVVVSLLEICSHLIALREMRDRDIFRLLSILDSRSFGGSPGQPSGLLHLPLSESIKVVVVGILNHLCDLLLASHVTRLIEFGKEYLSLACAQQQAHLDSLAEAEQYREEEFRRELADQLQTLMQGANTDAAQLLQVCLSIYAINAHIKAKSRACFI